MSGHPTTDATQADGNFAVFQQKLPELMATHAGKIALMHDGEIVDFFDSVGDAARFGVEKFGDFSKFSVQEVTNSVMSLGIHSYVGNIQ